MLMWGSINSSVIAGGMQFGTSRWPAQHSEWGSRIPAQDAVVGGNRKGQATGKFDVAPQHNDKGMKIKSRGRLNVVIENKSYSKTILRENHTRPPIPPPMLPMPPILEVKLREWRCIENKEKEFKTKAKHTRSRIGTRIRTRSKNKGNSIH